MPTIRIIVRYDGTGLSGWQRQRDVRTVQEEIERVASSMAGERVRVHGAGRTDAGVHALAQVAAFQTNARIPDKGWTLGMTAQLPPEIAVLEAREVPDGYDPRRAAAGKRYRYLLHLARIRDPLLRDRAWHLHDRLDLGAMARAANAFVGRHDFRAFRASDCERKNTIRHVFRVALVPAYAGVPELLAVEVEGTAFLKNMVRIMTGSLVDAARGRLAIDALSALLAGRGDRSNAGITAPAHGLYLDQVFVRPERRLPDDSLQLRPPYADAIIAAEPFPPSDLDDADSDE